MRAFALVAAAALDRSGRQDRQLNRHTATHGAVERPRPMATSHLATHQLPAVLLTEAMVASIVESNVWRNCNSSDARPASGLPLLHWLRPR